MIDENPQKSKQILQAGINCWKKAPAQRIRFLRDASEYFPAFAESASKAENSLMILGWDIDSRLPLLRSSSPRESRSFCHLLEFLNQLVTQRENLQVKILIWDFSIIYAAEREFLQRYKLHWKAHARIDFQLDGIHPLGGSHHQKIVVADDKIAFVGGLDLTSNRWDTPKHRLDDRRRVNPEGKPFHPYHDLQMIVDGEAAQSLGDLARTRWHRATGETLAPPPDSRNDPWPDSFPPLLRDLEVGIARTDPVESGSPVREVEQLYLDAIKKARRTIFLENQFLTSAAVCGALERRLQEEDGPEIVVILPHHGPGLILHKSMNVVREHFLHKLISSDRFNRLRAYYPTIEGQEIFVHAKCMIVDDTFVRIGSSNIANRSMGLDTECDLAVEVPWEDKKNRERIGGFRNQLLGEFLDATPKKIQIVLEREGSLIRTIESLPGEKRRLLPLKEELNEWTTKHLPEISLLDPEEPLLPRPAFEEFLPEEYRYPSKKRRFLFGGFLILLLIGLALLWHSSAMKSFLNPMILAERAADYIESPWTPAAVIGLYILAGFLVFPLTVLIVFTALLFDPRPALLYAFGGCMANAALTYAAGSLLGKNAFRSLLGKRLTSISERIGRNGILSTVSVRIIPVAPFSIVNFAAGASHIRFWDYMIGTLLGITPGILAIILLGDQLIDLIRSPSPMNLLIFLIVLVGVFVFYKLLRGLLARKKRSLPHDSA